MVTGGITNDLAACSYGCPTEDGRHEQRKRDKQLRPGSSSTDTGHNRYFGKRAKFRPELLRVTSKFIRFDRFNQFVFLFGAERKKNFVIQSFVAFVGYYGRRMLRIIFLSQFRFPRFVDVFWFDVTN